MWIGRLNIIEISLLSILIDRFSALSIKILIRLFEAIKKLVLKFTWKCKLPRRIKTFLKKKYKVGSLMLSDFKLL